MRVKVQLGDGLIDDDHNQLPRGSFWFHVKDPSKTTIKSLIHDIVDALDARLSPDLELDLSCKGASFLKSSSASILNAEDSLVLSVKKGTLSKRPEGQQKQPKNQATTALPRDDHADVMIHPSTSPQPEQRSRSAIRKAAKRARKRQGLPIHSNHRQHNNHAIPSSKNVDNNIQQTHHVRFDEEENAAISSQQKKESFTLSSLPPTIDNNTPVTSSKTSQKQQQQHSNDDDDDDNELTQLPSQLLQLIEDAFQRLKSCDTLPSVHDVIAYKILEMNHEKLMPQISEPRLGLVLAITPPSPPSQQQNDDDNGIGDTISTILTLLPYPDATIHPVTMREIKKNNSPQDNDNNDNDIDTTMMMYDDDGILHAPLSTFIDIRMYKSSGYVGPMSFSKQGPPQPAAPIQLSTIDQVKNAAEQLQKRRRSSGVGSGSAVVNAAVTVKQEDGEQLLVLEKGISNKNTTTRVVNDGNTTTTNVVDHHDGNTNRVVDRNITNVVVNDSNTKSVDPNITNVDGTTTTANVVVVDGVDPVRKERRKRMFSSVGSILHVLRSTQQLEDSLLGNNE